MRILFKYVNRRFILILIISLFAVMLFSFLIDTIESSKTITQGNTKLSLVLWLLFNKFIVMAVQTFPLSVYISLVLLIFSFHIRNEYLSFLTSGLNPYLFLEILFPIILFCGIVYFIFLDTLLPNASREVDRLMVFEFKRFTASWTYFYRDRNWFLGRENNIYHYIDIDDKQRVMRDFEVIKYNENGISEIIFVPVIRHIQKKEYQASIIKRYVLNEDGGIEYKNESSGNIILSDEFDIFRQRRGRPYQMSFSELNEFIKIREKAGLNTTRHLYELFNRIFTPISLVLLCLFNIVLFIRKLYLYKSGYFIFMSLFVLFIYFMISMLSSKLAESSLNLSLFAAILPSLVILISGIFLFYPSLKKLIRLLATELYTSF